MYFKNILVQYIFTSPEEIQYGLMNRGHPITFSTTALFVFPDIRQSTSMWMKNTYDNLDMIFISPEKKVVCIHRNAVALDLTNIPCADSGGIKYVVEALSGYIDEHKIQVGDQVAFNFMGILHYNENYKLSIL